MDDNLKPAKKSLRPKFILISFFFLIILIALYWVFMANKISQHQQINEETGKSRQEIKPMLVPQFIPPSQVKHQTRFNFTFDSPEVLAEYRSSEHLDQVTGGGPSTYKKTLNLMKWCRDQWQPGRPDPYPPIDAIKILREIRTGRTGGFCAQYNYLLVQGLQSIAIPARYVTVIDHEVTEVWIEEFKKWTCFDPLHNAYYTDPNGIPLSVYEIYQRLKQTREIVMVGDKLPENISAHLKKFSRFAVWLKNDHVSSPINFDDIEYYKLHYIDPSEKTRPLHHPGLQTSTLRDLYYPMIGLPK